MEEFEPEGLWWLPDTLEFSPNIGASLDLLSLLKDPGNQFAALERQLAEV